MAEENKKKKKSDDIRVDSGGTVEEVVSEHSSMKKEKKKKKKNREIKDGFAGEDGEIAERESEKLGEDALVKKNKSKKQMIDSEAGDGMKKKKSKKDKEAKVDSEAEDGVKKKKKKKKKKKSKKESGSDVRGNSESSKVCDKRKREDCDLGDEKYTDKEVKRKSKKKKTSVVSDTSLNSTNDAKRSIMETNTSVDPEAANKDSTKHAKKERKKKEKQQSVDSDVEDNNLINSTNDASKKSKEKEPSKDSELEEHSKNSKKDAKKIHNVDSEADENDLTSTKDAKKKRKKKKQSEVSEAEETNNDAKKKRKKKQECGQSDKDVTTPSSKSTKRVTFSDQVEFFPAEDEESEEDEAEVKLVRGKRFTKEEDELVKKAVLEYVDNHALGDNGIKMVMECKSHPQLKGCWKEIASTLPWRAYDSVYHRAHTIFEEGSKGVWTQEDLELVIEFQKKHGNDWRTLADALGKDRKHVKDAWRRIRLASKKKGHWTREEYQNLFDLVNKDIRMKAFQEKHAKHGMLKDNIPWMAISDVLGTRDHVTCCNKWYDQLTSPMVAKGTWANVDDYRLLEELLKLDAACIDDVDWDYLLENRDGEACRKRWNQMVLHIGIPKSKTFVEQVEILSERYRPDIAEDREDFDNRPYDPED
ncbi:PREDICTED: cyclin-D-binding Myb-like transcription factor 1 [Camelina sativa]|uniref:Cyclin-D-binding Myb-like transcription factor 1 n=1 Tax=Camelina sativa TaxID=90675 RepID=A0ABM0UHL0_CAMSA|nr:PREDICTED: cyclin-D-binding Myb-like transcription factor 1 [Camelina sativa]